jgi:TolB-like protein
MGTDPIRIRLFCLGHFRAERDGSPLDEQEGVQRKPLTLLKTLIALGGRNVPEDQLIESVWPEADGDAAHRSFSSTLHRLRAMLGKEALPLRQKQLTLDARQVWCDLLAFEAALAEADAASTAGEPAGVASAIERAVALYRGPFLEGEFDPPDILSTRERLHGRFLRALREGGALLERSAQSAGAIRLYQKGIEVDPVAEDLYQWLIRLYRQGGSTAEAEAVYQRLRRNLEAQGGIAPSAETEGARRAINPQLPERKTEATTNGEESTVPTAPAWVETVVPHGGEVHSLAVLPLTNMSGDRALDYFSDGLAEDLITDLSQYAQLAVVARNSSFQYKGRAVDVRQVGRDLGVRYVLEGSVRAGEEKDRLRITFQLADTATGSHLWAERFDRTLEDVFTLQMEIVDRVAVALDQKLVGGDRVLTWRRSSKSYESFKLFRRGLELTLQYSRYVHSEAIRLLAEATTIDPGFTMAWGILGWQYLIAYEYGWSEDRDQDLEHASECAHQALAINPADPFGHQLLARIACDQEDYEEAIRESRISAETEPGDPFGWVAYGSLLGRAGDPARGVEATQRGIALYPARWAVADLVLGMNYLMLEKCEQAIESLRKAIPLYRSSNAVALLAVAYVETGQLEAARALVPEILTRDPYFDPSTNLLVTGNRVKGYAERVIKALRAAGLKC